MFPSNKMILKTKIKMHAKQFHHCMKILTYLVNWTCPFIVVCMAIDGNVNLVLLPKFLKTLPSHGFPKRSRISIKGSRRVTQYPVCKEDQPWLLLSINRCKAVLDELVLLCPLPPILFCVSYTEPEHAIISGIPDRIKQ